MADIEASIREELKAHKWSTGSVLRQGKLDTVCHSHRFLYSSDLEEAKLGRVSWTSDI